MIPPSNQYRPTRVPNCTLWLPYTGATGSDWNDRSGAGRNFTASGSPSVSGGVPTFDGVNDQYSSGGVAMSAIFTSTAKTLFIVLNATAAANDSTSSFLQSGAFCDAGEYFGVHVRSSGKMRVYNWDGNDDFTEHNYTLGTKVLLSCTHDGANIRSRINGGTELVTASGTTAVMSGQMHVGRAGAAVFWTGPIYEVVCYNRVLSSVEYFWSVRKLILRHRITV